MLDVINKEAPYGDVDVTVEKNVFFKRLLYEENN